MKGKIEAQHLHCVVDVGQKREGGQVLFVTRYINGWARGWLDVSLSPGPGPEWEWKEKRCQRKVRYMLP